MFSKKPVSDVLMDVVIGAFGLLVVVAVGCAIYGGLTTSW